MAKRESKFCSLCGQPLVARQSLVYDEYTGVPLVEKVCMTYGCRNNRICTNYTHETKFFSPRCVKCGHYADWE